MRSTETLRQLEECYELFHPADENSAEAFIWFSKIPHPFLNAVMHLMPEGDFEAKIDRIIQNIPADLPYSFWVISDPTFAKIAAYLEKKQFKPFFTCSLMRWAVEPIIFEGADIRPADPEHFNDIIASVNQLDVSAKNEFSELLKKGPCENALLYVDNKPISTGSLVHCGYYGAIFNEAALPGYGGHMHAMIEYLMQRAYTLRMQQLVVLSTPEYETIYKKLGFKKTGEVVLYIPPLK